MQTFIISISWTCLMQSTGQIFIKHRQSVMATALACSQHVGKMSQNAILKACWTSVQVSGKSICIITSPTVQCDVKSKWTDIPYLWRTRTENVIQSDAGSTAFFYQLASIFALRRPATDSILATSDWKHRSGKRGSIKNEGVEIAAPEWSVYIPSF